MYERLYGAEIHLLLCREVIKHVIESERMIGIVISEAQLVGVGIGEHFVSVHSLLVREERTDAEADAD